MLLNVKFSNKFNSSIKMASFKDSHLKCFTKKPERQKGRAGNVNESCERVRRGGTLSSDQIDNNPPQPNRASLLKCIRLLMPSNFLSLIYFDFNSASFSSCFFILFHSFFSEYTLVRSWEKSIIAALVFLNWMNWIYYENFVIQCYDIEWLNESNSENTKQSTHFHFSSITKWSKVFDALIDNKRRISICQLNLSCLLIVTSFVYYSFIYRKERNK